MTIIQAMRFSVLRPNLNAYLLCLVDEEIPFRLRAQVINAWRQREKDNERYRNSKRIPNS